MNAIYAILIVVALIALYAIGLTLNKRTPVPEGCENLKPECNACGIQSCAMRNQVIDKGEMNNG